MLRPSAIKSSQTFAQIAGTSEVKAQVKLRFNNIKNEKMLVERRLEVKKKKNVSGLAMKTLEATISKVDKDEDTSVGVLGLVYTIRH